MGPICLITAGPFYVDVKKWRLISLRQPHEVEDLNFRAMKGIIVPFIEMKIPIPEPDKNDHLPLVEIIQGPLVLKQARLDHGRETSQFTEFAEDYSTR